MGIDQLTIGQRLYGLVAGGTSAVIGLTALCVYTAYRMHAALLIVPLPSASTLQEMRDELILRAIVISVVSLAAVLPFFWLVVHSIVMRLKAAQNALEAVARGDLTHSIVTRGKDEVSQLMQVIAGMQRNLAEVIGQIRVSSGEIREAIEEVAAGNDDLSRRTERQAASLQKTNADISVMSHSVQETSHAADEAANLAGRAMNQTTDGATAVGRCVTRMHEIKRQSSRIAEIVGTIEGIASQTNILALNASVESARAGELGRGFAVVANEVRSLAQRCSDAAREIKNLIGFATKEIELGVREADLAGTSIGNLAVAVNGASVLITKVSSSIAGQADGLARVRAECEQLDGATQQNAALVEELAAAAASVKTRADGLVTSVETFTISQ